MERLEHLDDEGELFEGETEPLGVEDEQTHRWFSAAVYVIFVALVAAVLILLFLRFTGSVRLAVVLVGFMVAYMVVAGWVASRGHWRA